MENVLKVLSYHGQRDIHELMSNMPERSSRAQGEVASTVLLQFSRKEMITWHEMRQLQQPHHYTVWQWRFYPIVQTCKKWVMTLSSSMAMYSVMRDIPDARNVPMERGWVALYLYATRTFSNQLTLEQWAFEYGLPFKKLLFMYLHWHLRSDLVIYLIINHSFNLWFSLVVVDPCVTSPCLNDATCSAFNCTSRQCLCPECYHGDSCETSQFQCTFLFLQSHDNLVGYTVTFHDSSV